MKRNSKGQFVKKAGTKKRKAKRKSRKSKRK